MCYEIPDKRPTEKIKEAKFFSHFNLATIVFVPLFILCLAAEEHFSGHFRLSFFFFKISFDLFVGFDLFPEHWQLTLVQHFRLFIFLI